MSTIISFLKDCSGATSIEYAAIACGVAVAIVTVLSTLGSSVLSNYTAINSLLK